MQQVLTLEVYLRALQSFSQALRIIKYAGPSGEVRKVIVQLCFELPVFFCGLIFTFQLVERYHKRFRDVFTPEDAEMAFFVWQSHVIRSEERRVGKECRSRW